MIRFLSVCSGIEAASQALHARGFECAAVSEIEPHPCAVLAHRFGASRPWNMPHPDDVPTHNADGSPRFPQAIKKERQHRAAAIKAMLGIPSGDRIPNFGDMSRFQEWPDADYDALFGGTPCQSFSVAGLRAGLDDPRGNLMLTFGAIAARFRPRWVCWENVPGVLSSNGGRDFASLLGLLSGRSIVPPPEGWQNSGIVPGIADAYGLAWCVLDAQYIRTSRFRRAVPQRRRRVFVVGYSGDWRRAAAVLFDAESLRRDPPPSRSAGQRPAPTISARPTGGGGLGTDFDLDGGLIANSGAVGYCLTAQGQQSLDAETETLIAVAHALRGEGHDASEDGTGRGTPIIAIQERAVSENPDAGPGGVGVSTEGAAYTLEARTQVQAVAFAENQKGEVSTSDVASQLNTGGGKPGQGYPAIAFSFKDYGNDASDKVSLTLRSPEHYDANGGSQMAVAFDMRGREGGAVPEGPHDTANIRAASGGSSRSYVAQPWAVRRLTPVECERLMGMEDGFTNIPWRGRDSSPDGNRYKELGNSWALNSIDWIGERMAIVDGWP